MEEIVITRRAFLSGLGSMGIALTGGTAAVGQQHKRAARLPQGIGVEPDFAGPLPTPENILGRERALDSEVLTANALLAGTPVGPTPIDVARYFLQVGNGTFGEAWRPYIKGWPVRWNPVIVAFFQSTKTKPEGDITAWCAAFVNWCFQKSGKGIATQSASSGSFRTFGNQTTSPRPGDLVVFERTDPTERAAGHGHVGFFVATKGDLIEVLGGNQIEGHERSHMISSKKLSKNGSILKLHSYRTDISLHD